METIVIPKGPLPQFPGSMVQTLRELGLLVDLKNMQVVLQEECTICTEGKLLSPEQAKLLVCCYYIPLISIRFILTSLHIHIGTF